MNKEIEEMARAIMATEYFDDGASCLKYKCQENCNCGGYEIAEELYNAGCRKTVWHKVADGDLPKDKTTVIICFNSRLYGCTNYTIDLFSNGEFLNFNEDVIAWTELPKYEGEE